MGNDETLFKRMMIVALAKDIAKLHDVWMEQIRPTYVRWDFIVNKLPDASMKAYTEVRDQMIMTLQALVDPFFADPAAYGALLGDLGFLPTDDVLSAAAQKMGASFKPVALDETTRPIAIREARIAFIAKTLFFEDKSAKILDARYVSACERRDRAPT